MTSNQEWRTTRKGFLANAAKASLVVLGAPTAVELWSEGQIGTLAGADPNDRLNLRDFTAVGDRVTDDGPALQRALNALGTAGGGELVIPPGKYRVTTPVVIDFGGKASAIRIVGYGSVSQLVIRAGANAAAIRIGNLEHLVIQGLTFVGVPNVRNDAGIVLALTYCDVVAVRDCSFYGLASADSDPAAVIDAGHCDLMLQRCSFRGCATNGAVVRNFEWLGFRAEDCFFIDYGTLNGQYHAKTPIVVGKAWMQLLDPWIAPQRTANAQGVVTVRNVKADEGTNMLDVNPGSNRLTRVHVDGVDVNAHAGGFGISVANTDSVVIENSFIGYTSVVTDAIRLRNVKSSLISRTFCLQQADRITVDADCDTVTIAESVYSSLNSSAKNTTIIQSGKGGVVPMTKPGTVTDADFDVPPPDGTLAVDTTGSQLFVRTGGTWKSVALGVATPGTPPSAPTGLTATAVGATRVNLTWSANPSSENIAKYTIQRGTQAIGESTTTSYGDTTVRAASTYEYTVTAVSAAGTKSSPSSPVRVTTPAQGASTAFVTSFTPSATVRRISAGG